MANMKNLIFLVLMMLEQGISEVAIAKKLRIRKSDVQQIKREWA